MAFSELLATYAGLGTRDGEDYFRGDECLACVKDLIRALRDDDSRCETRRQLGMAGIVEKDLVPIMLGSADNILLRNDVIRLLVNLTQPAYLCFGGAYPQKKDIDMMKCFMEVNKYLRIYKEAFTEESVMYFMGSILADLCQKSWDERDDDDIIVIERILLLIRNLLHVTPDQLEEKRTEDDVSLHDQIIWNLHINGIDELLLFLGSNQDEKQWCMHVLEIVFLMMKEQSPSTLARTGKGRTAQEKKRDENLVDEVLARERARRTKAQHIRGTRHSSFGGTFVVKNQRSISGKERIYHRPLAGLNDYSYDLEKKPRRTPKPRRAAKDVPKERMSTYSIRVVLMNMCVQFLECCYNPLMRVVKDNIMHQRAMDNDETYYLWCLRFFMEFSRVHDFRVDIISETLQLQTLHYIIQLVANYYESMVVEKRSVGDARQWAQRLHYAVQAYKELLLHVQEMSSSRQERFSENGKVMQSNIFYHPEYRDVFVTLLRNFHEVFQTKSCLCDIIETTHIYVRMMEQHCQENKHLVVQERRKKGGKKKKRKKGTPALLTEDQLTDLWERIDARLEELLEGCEPLPGGAIPFDAASDIPIEEQKIETMGRIRMLLIDAEHPEAVSLMRAAREVWPEEEFGHNGMSVVDELQTIKDILFNPAAALPAVRLLEDGGGSDGDEEEAGAETSATATVELEFDLKKYIQRFSNNKIVRAYCLVLADYASNSEAINHAVVKMLYRIAVQLKMAPLLYQVSVFRTLQEILHEAPNTSLKELQKFARYTVAGFFHMSTTNPLMFVELLFWKTSQDCYELSEGYGVFQRERELREMGSTWTREQEEELAELFERYQGDEDVVGCIQAALHGDVSRSRKQVINQIMKQGLASDRKRLHKNAKKTKKGGWTEEEVCLLQDSFQPQEDYKEAVREVASLFPERGTHEVTRQLRLMGLIPDKTKRKKRGTSDSPDGTSSSKRKFRSASIVDTTDSESGGDNRQSNTNGKQKFRSASIVDTTDSESDGGILQSKATSSATKPKQTGEISSAVARLHSQGYSDQLAWLEAYLKDEARDRSVDDEWEEMCIVAVSNQISRALTGKEFQEVLGQLGLQPPSDQEMYWRIPASMSPQHLIDAASMLRPGEINGGQTSVVVSEDEEEESKEDNDIMEADNRDEKSSDEEEYGHNSVLSRSEALAALLRSKGKTLPSSDKKRLEKEKPPPKRPRLANRETFLESSSDEEKDSPEVVTQTKRTPGERRKRVRQLDLDSDNEDEDTNTHIGNVHNGCDGGAEVIKESKDEMLQPKLKKFRNSDGKHCSSGDVLEDSESDGEGPGLQIDLDVNDCVNDEEQMQSPVQCQSPVSNTGDLNVSTAEIGNGTHTVEESASGSMQDLIMSQTIS